jgi:tubulin-like protein CetZ
MKLCVIGCGQCGGRIADEFARINVKARVQRGIEITTGVIAVNTDVSDLSGLFYIKRDFLHRVVIGGQKTGGHGVGKINELGAEVAREDSDKVFESLRSVPNIVDTDAFLLTGSCAGGTGSGAIPILTQQIKEHYPDKPVYNLLVLPFKHEESTEERTIYNAATCLKSSYLVADAVFLMDNQRFVKKEFSLKGNISRINAMIVDPFFNLLCAGEETRAEFIGAKILDAGDIIQTLSGWTILGHGSINLSRFNLPIHFPINLKRDFIHKASETNKGMQAVDSAISELSLKCNTQDSRKALYLLSGPPREMNMELMKEMGAYIRRIAPEALIRSGDYPREKNSIQATVIFSELTYLGKIMDYFNRVIVYLSNKKKRKTITLEQRGLEEAFQDIPSLL